MLDFEDVGPLEVSGMSDSRVCTCDKPSLQAVVVAVAVMMVVVGVVGGGVVVERPLSAESLYGSSEPVQPAGFVAVSDLG